MPANYAELNAAIEEAVANATEIEGSAASVESILGSVGSQIEAALTADNALDNAATAAAVAVVRTVIDRNKASAKKISGAIASNNPTAPAPDPGPGPNPDPDPNAPQGFGRRR